MRHAIFGLATFVAVFCASGADAAVFTGAGGGVVDGKEVSAWVQFEIVDGNLVINLKNTGERDDYTPAQVVTDISFTTNRPNLDFVVTPGSEDQGSRVDVADGSSLWLEGEDETGITNVSKEWGLSQNVLLPLAGDPNVLLGPYQFSVTGTAPLPFNDEDDIRIFADGEIEPSSKKLNGMDFGLINMATINNPNVSPSISGKYMVADSVKITLVTDQDLTGLQITDATFSYGSSHEAVGVPDDAIPEPATLVIWSVLGLCFAGACRWRRRGGNMGRGGRGSAWSQDSVEAIHQIIDRGRLSR